MADPLSVNDRRLAAATKRAVQAAGGLKVCEDETKRSDSLISRYCSPNHHDSVSVRDAVRIDIVGAREAGHPHIINTMAELLGGVFIMLPEPVTDDRSLQMSVIDLSCELGDVSRSIADALAGTSAGGSTVTTKEAEAALAQLADHDRAAARLRLQLERIARGDTAPAT